MINKVPVEFRELINSVKGQSQGIIEMWTEIYTEEEAKQHPMATLKPPSKEEYEIRLIIWETRDVTLVGGDSVNIYVKIIYDPIGWAEEGVEKKTDVHYNSKDGRGEFNWRMKFKVSMPCQFPRLKFQVYNYSILGDSIIGENTLSLQKTLNKLQKEGEIEIPKAWINLENPEDPTDDCGRLKFQMDIVTMMKAESEPVGEAWDEPNVNPRLERPTSGRSWADTFAGAGISISGFGWPSWWGLLRYTALLGGIVSVLGKKIRNLYFIYRLDFGNGSDANAIK